jgi:hypothetical protein
METSFLTYHGTIWHSLVDLYIFYLFQGLRNINSDIVSLAERARANKLQPHEFQVLTLTAVLYHNYTKAKERFHHV